MVHTELAQPVVIFGHWIICSSSCEDSVTVTPTMNLYVVMLRTLLVGAVIDLVDAANVRCSLSNNIGSPDEPSYSQRRQLQGDGMRDFQPLSCNANLASAACSTWSSVFGTGTSYATRITIPCGQCITMDHVGDLELLGGLDVIGKLVFPDGYSLNLASTMISVMAGKDEEWATWFQRSQHCHCRAVWSNRHLNGRR
jgi:hypothetical protein